MRPRGHTEITKGQMHIASDTVFTTDATPDTYTKVAGSWSDGHLLNFTVDDVNDRLVYTGLGACCALFSGISSVKANKGCTLTYALYQKGVSVHDTPVDIPTSGKAAALTASAIIHVSAGDYFEVWVKSDTASVELTIHNLNILLFGEY